MIDSHAIQPQTSIIGMKQTARSTWYFHGDISRSANAAGSELRGEPSVSIAARHSASVRYAPPGPARGADEEWHAQLDGLDADLGALYRTLGDNALVLLTGDFNVQPAILGGGPDPSPLRAAGWATLVDRWSLVLRNPGLHGQSPVDVWLPARDRAVRVRAGDTHHGPGVSRAIDLAASSANLMTRY